MEHEILKDIRLSFKKMKNNTPVTLKDNEEQQNEILFLISKLSQVKSFKYTFKKFKLKSDLQGLFLSLEFDKKSLN